MNLSDLLYEIARNSSGERISIRQLIDALEDRAFGAMMALFALPNVLPTPPGTSIVLGLPLVYLSAQLMLGRRPWLPAMIMERSVSRSGFKTFVDRSAPWIRRTERLLSPRLFMLVDGPAECVIGAMCLLSTVVLILPIPFGNIPPACAICLFAFAILGRDGAFVLAGFAATVLSLIFVSGIILTLFSAFFFAISQFLA